MDQPLSKRKSFVLLAILQSYIETAEPVGSRTLKRKYHMDVSAATIRNEMSDLELVEMLTKAHTSSGRIPSQKAYRWYVDELLKSGKAESDVLALGEVSLLKESAEFQNILDNALQILSDTTNYATLASLPGRGEDSLKKIQLIPLSTREVVMVLIFNTKVIHTELVHLSEAYSLERIQRAGDILSELFEGRQLGELSGFLNSDFFSTEIVQGNLISELVSVLRKKIDDNLQPRLIFHGLTKLYGESENEKEVTDFIRYIQHSEELLALMKALDPNSLMDVLIGEEIGIDALSDFSLVLAPYQIQDGFVGRMGVLAPTRMRYRTAISDVSKMSKYLSSITMRV